MEKQTNDGKIFEKLNYVIQEVLKDSPHTKVFYDHHINDRDGISRQFDVYIESKINGFENTIAIECKDEGRNVGISKIDAFADKCLECGINVKVMVASKGFTKDAKLKAPKKFIKLYTLKEISIDVIKNWILVDNIRRVETNIIIKKAVALFNENSGYIIGSELLPSNAIFNTKVGVFTI